MPQAPSTRWCPTPEQLMILEEMYRSGVRTPNASHIQQITAHLSHYGKIEGKNVFYWFQNHKARDRQKLRRRLGRSGGGGQLLLHHHHYHPHLPLNVQSFEEAASHPSPHFSHQQGCYQESTQGMNLLSKLEVGGGGDRDEAPPSTYGYEWTVMTDPCSALPPCCWPPKTLDLFPTKSTGLRDEYCSTSKSSSCSTSTNTN